jgi:ABC-type antimicrobial peptide transport system permease subunit
MRSFLTILLTNLRRNFFRSFFSSIGIIIGIGSLYFFITIGTGINAFITGSEMQKLPMNMLRIRTTEMSLGIFRFGQPGFMKSATIAEGTIADIRRIEGVKSVYPVMNVLFPISAILSFQALLPEGKFGTRYRTDLIMSGAPEELVGEDIQLPNIKFTGKTWPVPVLISRHILDIYNSGFAGSQGLPKLSEKALLGFRFDLLLGRSTLIREMDVEGITIPCQVVGFTEKSEMLGLVMPLDYVKRYNARYVSGWRESRYSSVYILAHSSDKVATIADEIEKLGYTVFAEKKVSNLILLVTLMLGLFSTIIIIVAAISIFNAFTVIVNQRQMEIGLFRSFGATRLFIKSLFLSEAAVVGTMTGGIGLALGIFLVRLTWNLVAGALPAFFQSLDTIFPVSVPLLLILLGGSLFTSLVATFLPATVASRIEISNAVRR